MYCSVGYRSEKISEKLTDLGFQNVSNLYGGMFGWVNAEQPIVSGQGKPTDEIHPYDKKWGKWLERGTKKYE